MAGRTGRAWEPGGALKSVTINTQAYVVPGGGTDKRSLHITADEPMRIVAMKHFTGVQRGGWSDNGHILSGSPDNPWVRWEGAGTGMGPTGARGYFGYCSSWRRIKGKGFRLQVRKNHRFPMQEKGVSWNG